MDYPLSRAILAPLGLYQPKSPSEKGWVGHRQWLRTDSDWVDGERRRVLASVASSDKRSVPLSVTVQIGVEYVVIAGYKSLWSRDIWSVLSASIGMEYSRKECISSLWT